MDANFSKVAHGGPFMVGRSWTFMDAHFSEAAHGWLRTLMNGHLW